MARLYANENFPAQVVAALRALGHDVPTSMEAGMANQAIGDEAVLEFASRDGRTLLTLNRWDFVRVHQNRPDHAGIVVCSRDPDCSGQSGRIDKALRSCPTLLNQLVRVNRPA